MQKPLWIAVRRALILCYDELPPIGQRAATIVIVAIEQTYNLKKHVPRRQTDTGLPTSNG